MKEIKIKGNSLRYLPYADAYFDRNIGKGVSIFTKYLKKIFPTEGKAIAEFGTGDGANVFFLKADGYDCSEKAVKNIRRRGFKAKLVNLAEPFAPIRKYDLVIMGFYCYYLDDNEVLTTIKNVKNALKKGGYIFFYDFISRQNREKADKRHQGLKVYKRNLIWWLEKFAGYDLIDFKLWGPPEKDDEWHCSLFLKSR